MEGRCNAHSALARRHARDRVPLHPESTKDRNESNPPRAAKNEPRYVKEVLLMVHRWYAGNCSLGELMSALRKAVEEDENNRCFNGNHPRDENGVCLIDGGKC